MVVLDTFVQSTVKVAFFRDMVQREESRGSVSPAIKIYREHTVRDISRNLRFVAYLKGPRFALRRREKKKKKKEETEKETAWKTRRRV